MFQTSAFGHTYAAAGPASVGVRIYDATVQTVSFARNVELQKLRLEKRRLNMQEAQMAASRENANRNFELADTRYELERRRLEMDDADRQQKREMAMQQFQQSMADRAEARDLREREFQARQQEAQDAREFRRSEAEFNRGLRREELDWQRQYRQMTMDDRREDRETRRAQQELTRGQYEASQAERQRTASEAARRERNNVLQAGGYELQQGEEPKTGYRLYEGPEGRRYAVPAVQQKQTEKKPQYTTATIDKAMSRVNSRLTEYADAIKAGKEGETPMDDAQKETAMAQQRGLKAMDAYKSAAYLNNDLLRAMPPNFVADIDWTGLPAEAVDDFMKYLDNGVFDNPNMNALIKRRLLDAAKEEKERRETEKKKAEQARDKQDKETGQTASGLFPDKYKDFGRMFPML